MTRFSRADRDVLEAIDRDPGLPFWGIADRSGYSTGTAAKSITRLKKDGFVERFSGGNHTSERGKIVLAILRGREAAAIARRLAPEP